MRPLELSTGLLDSAPRCFELTSIEVDLCLHGERRDLDRTPVLELRLRSHRLLDVPARFLWLVVAQRHEPGVALLNRLRLEVPLRVAEVTRKSIAKLRHV